MEYKPIFFLLQNKKILLLQNNHPGQAMVQFPSLLAGALTRQISEDRKNNNSLSTLSFIKAVTICPGIVIMQKKRKKRKSAYSAPLQTQILAFWQQEESASSKACTWKISVNAVPKDTARHSSFPSASGEAGLAGSDLGGRSSRAQEKWRCRRPVRRDWTSAEETPRAADGPQLIFSSTMQSRTTTLRAALIFCNSCWSLIKETFSSEHKDYTLHSTLCKCRCIS